MDKRIDLTGQRFGRLVVENFSHTDKHGHSMWACLCDCGNRIVTRSSLLLGGKTKSCGCIRLEKFDILSPGQRFGRLTVLHRAGKNKRGRNLWMCSCECGSITAVETHSLICGGIQSCGCLRNELATYRLTTHGLRHTKLYHVWAVMVQRTESPQAQGYKNYGGRGIKVCDEWRRDFQAFYNWAMSHGYQEGLTIDRIDVNGNYCPENCRWATRKEQANNQRKTIRIEYGGQSLTITEAAEQYNIPRSLLVERLRRGWTPQEAIELPPHTHRKKKK